MILCPDNKTVKYWEKTFIQCDAFGWEDAVKQTGMKKICLKTMIEDFNLNDHLDKIAIIMNEAVNIFNLNSKLRAIKTEMIEMAIELKEHGLTGKKGLFTYLMLGSSIEENQQLLDEHITSV